MARSIAVISARRRRRGNSGPITLVTDTFTRADSAVSLGTADTGQAWTAHVGTWGISANQAQFVATTGGENVASLDTGVSAMSVSVTLNPFADRQRVMASLSDGSNYITGQVVLATGAQVFKVVAGVFTQLGSTYAYTPASGDVLKLVRSGTSIALYVNGVLAVSATDAFNSTATRAGIGQSNAAPIGQRWDNFTVTTP